MSTRTQHVWEFIETLVGPIVFVAYFGLAYLATTFGCSLAADAAFAVAPSKAVGVALAALTATALVALAVIAGAAARRVYIPAAEADEEDVFLAYLTLILAALAAVAVFWTAAPDWFPLCDRSLINQTPGAVGR